jgi:hypothetical protein
VQGVRQRFCRAQAACFATQLTVRSICAYAACVHGVLVDYQPSCKWFDYNAESQLAGGQAVQGKAWQVPQQKGLLAQHEMQAAPLTCSQDACVDAACMAHTRRTAAEVLPSGRAGYHAWSVMDEHHHTWPQHKEYVSQNSAELASVAQQSRTQEQDNSSAPHAGFR